MGQVSVQQQLLLKLGAPNITQRKEKSEFIAYCGMGEHHLTKLWHHFQVNKVKPEVTENWTFGLRLLFHCEDLTTIG